VRQCRVTLRDSEGIAHSVEVTASTLFEAAASAIATFREAAWAADALTPNAVLRIEVQPPAITHDVPLRAVERWSRSPSASPKEAAAKQLVGTPKLTRR